MAKTSRIITKQISYKGKTIIIQTDSLEYLEGEVKKYNEDTSKKKDAR
jgi:hypothetical protein